MSTTQITPAEDPMCSREHIAKLKGSNSQALGICMLMEDDYQYNRHTDLDCLSLNLLQYYSISL